jgi:RNase adaptor protein for sRNA GlmZ degradation
LVDASVENYKSRGFANLMVAFGCTGGQHRSVYLAEHLASHLRQKAGVEVVVRHLQLEKLAAKHSAQEPASAATVENMSR